MNYTGIILAGGKSSRMGEDKGLLLLNGVPMVQHLIHLFEELKIPTIIIANNSEYKQFNLPIFNDIVEEKGPAGGILTGLTHSPTEKNIIVSCDSPFVTKELILFLIKSHQENQVTIPFYQNRIHPLIGIYEKSARRIIQSCIERKQLKIRFILEELNTRQIEIPEHIAQNGKSLTNINTKEELNQLKNED